MLKKSIKTISFILAFVIAFSCFLSVDLSAEESDIFTYYVSGNSSILTGVKNSVSGSVVVPDTLGGYPVVSVEGAFNSRSKITSVVLPDTVNTIANNSFAYCSKLKSIEFSENLAVIGEAAFCGCTALEEVELPAGVKQIGEYAFSWCESLSRVTFPTSLITIERGAFSGCINLDNIDIPLNVSYVMQDAFGQTKYYNTAENWEDGVLYAGAYLLAAKDTVFGVYEVKEGTKTVADRAFSMCSSMTGIIIHKGMKVIGKAAFYGCKGLSDVYFTGTIDDRRKLDIGANNTYFTGSNATWHYGYDPNVKEYAPGDINGDDVVNNKDALRLFKYLSDWEVEVIDSVLDVNGDGSINNMDLSRLFQYLSDWDVKIYSATVGQEFNDEDHGPIISF